MYSSWAVALSGSSEGHTAYLYRCTHTKPTSKAAKGAKSAKGDKASIEDPVVVVSDGLFKVLLPSLNHGTSHMWEWCCSPRVLLFARYFSFFL